MKNQVEQVSFPNLKQSDGWRLAKRRRALYGVSGWRAISDRNIKEGSGIEPESWGRETSHAAACVYSIARATGNESGRAAEKNVRVCPGSEAVEKGVLQLQPESLQLFAMPVEFQ